MLSLKVSCFKSRNFFLPQKNHSTPKSRWVLPESRVCERCKKGGVSCWGFYPTSRPTLGQKDPPPCVVLRFAVRVFHQIGSVPGGKLSRRRSRWLGVSPWAR